MKTQRKPNTKKLTLIAVLAALSSVLFLIEIPIVAFYKLDLSNLAVMLGTFAMGPAAGIAILGLKDLIGVLHSSSGGIGELADFITGLAFLLPAALLYTRRKTRGGALTGMLLGVVATVVVGVAVNKWIMLPFYMGRFKMGMEQIVAMAKVAGVDSEGKLLLLVTAPFNLLKGLVIGGVTFLVYKPLSPFLHGKGIKG